MEFMQRIMTKCEICGKSSTNFKRYYWKQEHLITIPAITKAKWSTISEEELQSIFVNRNIMFDKNGEKSFMICQKCFDIKTKYDQEINHG